MYPEQQTGITPSCKGRVYRYTERLVAAPDGNITFVKQLVLQKDLSCSGCEHCDWVHEQIYCNEGYHDFGLDLDYVKYKKDQLYYLTGVSTKSYHGEYDVEFTLKEYTNELQR